MICWQSGHNSFNDKIEVMNGWKKQNKQSVSKSKYCFDLVKRTFRTTFIFLHGTFNGGWQFNKLLFNEIHKLSIILAATWFNHLEIKKQYIFCIVTKQKGQYLGRKKLKSYRHEFLDGFHVQVVCFFTGEILRLHWVASNDISETTDKTYLEPCYNFLFHVSFRFNFPWSFFEWYSWY